MVVIDKSQTEIAKSQILNLQIMFFFFFFFFFGIGQNKLPQSVWKNNELYKVLTQNR